MKATTHSGEVLTLRPGTNISGLRLISVELTAQDFADELAFDWLREVIAVRMVPPSWGKDE